MQENPLPRMPVISPWRIFALRDELAAYMINNDYIDRELTGSDIAKLSLHFSRLSKLPAKSVGLICKSLLYLVGRKIDQTECRSLAFRFAGNKHNLKKGNAVQEWACQTFDEWVCAQITEVTMSYNKMFKKHLIVPVYLIISGTPAGKYFSRSFPRKFLPIFASNFGFGRKGKWDITPEEITNLRVRLLLLQGPKFNFEDYKVLDKEHNKKILELRKSPCPNRFKCKCINCHVGLNECQAAIRPVTLIEKKCTNGHMGPFDPRFNTSICIDCIKKKQET
jgi:hypothetical protein